MSRVVVSAAGAIRGRRGLVLRGTSAVRDERAAQIHAAVVAGLAAHKKQLDVPWWPELGPLNTAERRGVKRVVAAIVTYECAAAVRLGCAR